MIHLITYGDSNYTNSKKLLQNEAMNTNWFDTITVYGPNDLDNNFINKNIDILRRRRGGGYWLWKPYIIHKRLNEINYDDYLIYLDAGCKINNCGEARFYAYIEMLKNNDMIAFQLDDNCFEKYYTTNEIFDYFNIDKDSEIRNTKQYIGGILIMKKTHNTLNIINTCMDIVNNKPLLFTDDYNKNQMSYFIDNRHDQSILSIIRKKSRGIQVLSDETYFSDFGNEKSLKYPFWATRRR